MGVKVARGRVGEEGRDVRQEDAYRLTLRLIGPEKSANHRKQSPKSRGFRLNRQPAPLDDLHEPGNRRRGPDGGEGAGIKLEEISFDAIGEDDAAGRHERLDVQRPAGQ